VCRLTDAVHREIAVGELIGPLHVAGHPWGQLPEKLYLGKTRRNLTNALLPRHPELFNE
jgi:hypothetical protein